MKTKKYVLVAIFGLLSLLAPRGARADAIFLVTNTFDAGPGSLRQAIIDSNATPGTNLVNFFIAGAGLQDIVEGATTGLPLPVITTSVAIDGGSQPGASQATPLIEIDTSLLPGSFTPGTAFNVAPGVSLEVKDIIIIPASVPEPSSLLLLGSGLIGGIGAMRRRFPK